MTRRQRLIWKKKLQEREKRMLNYYFPYTQASKEPDGSFMMSAFINGWDAAVRSLKLKEERS